MKQFKNTSLKFEWSFDTQPSSIAQSNKYIELKKSFWGFACSIVVIRPSHEEVWDE